MRKLAVVGLVVGAAVLMASKAHAQCGIGAGVVVCGGAYVAPPPIYVAPPPIYVAPPPVYVAPPPVYVPPPPARVVLVSPPPPPVVVQTQTQTVQLVAPAPSEFVRHRGFGFGARASGGYAGLTDVGMWGGGIVLRYIANPRFGVELTVDGFGGTGYAGADRIEFPVTLNGIWFANPRNHVQLYLVGGIGISAAEVEGENGLASDSPLYVGGQLGLGVEFLLGHHIGLTLDARAFVRSRVNERPDVPFAHDGSCRIGDDGAQECTDLEAGATFNAGFNFYL